MKRKLDPPQWKFEPTFNLTSHMKKRLRERFYAWPPHRMVKQAARLEMERFKKDGTKYKVPWVKYTCNICKDDFQGNRVQVDHILPVEPVEYVEYEDWQDEMEQYVIRLFAGVDGLQVLCKECHKKKSNKENAERRKNKKEGKDASK